ncbi:hypothetical protein CR513_23644, partial [Mucuna pruriens]
MNCEVLEDIYKCIERLSENDEFVDHIHNELPIYKRATKCYECRDLIDPIVLNDTGDSNEWIVGKLDGDGEDVEDELVFYDDVLTWKDVDNATGATKPLKYTRRQTQMQRTTATSTSWKRKEKGVVEEDESSEDEGEEEYNSSSNGSDEGNDKKLQEDDKDY